VAISGVLLHAIYLGGVWWAIAKGLPAGISGLIAAVQPILTAVLAPTLAGERITRLHWAGIALGFVGIAMVLEPKLLGLTGSVSGLVWPIIVNVAAMVSVTFGHSIRNALCDQAICAASRLSQMLGAALATLPIALLTESFRFEWNQTLVLTMAWSVLALSMGAIGLPLLLIRNGAVIGPRR
jgi:drug/metabolite transporter (DMT)-like permease